MQRREFVTLLGGAVIGWPLRARAQQPAMPVIGYLSGATSEMMRGSVTAFRHGLADAGFAEGHNVAIEYRWAEEHNDRLPALAADLVRRDVTVIVVGGSTPGALAAKDVTKTVPIVFLVGPDPVKIGLVASLNRPGGNLTGITLLNVELISKCLDLIHNLIPPGTTIAVLINP
ncbi:MAG: ABC transporter substrate-binding protein, partial [Pseudolabrys sp.]